jgi:hypothetical protein
MIKNRIHYLKTSLTAKPQRRLVFALFLNRQGTKNILVDLSSKTLLVSDLALPSYRFYDYYDNYRIIQNYITK